MSGRSCFSGSWEGREVQFILIGQVACPDFQQCLAVIEYLHKRLPKRFPTPFIRPMLEFDWAEYKVRAQRKFSGKIWTTEHPFIIYAEDQLLRSSEELQDYLSQWFRLKSHQDLECLAMKGVVDIYEKYLELGRSFVYFSLSRSDTYIGTLIIMLYSDIVPKTCKNFIKRCVSQKTGYKGTKMHRVMNKSWIQFADFTIPIASMPNENYIVPHNRRGVVSMCSNKPNTANKTQFYITLDATPWMDYKYVAFGQVMQGEYILRQLETLPLYYESPDDKVTIINCGELKFEEAAIVKNIPRIKDYIETRETTEIPDVVDLRDVPSILLQANYKSLKYCYFEDTCPHTPLNNIPSSFFSEPTMFSAFSQGYGTYEEERFVMPHSIGKRDAERISESIQLKDVPRLKSIESPVNMITDNYDIKKYVSEDYEHVSEGFAKELREVRPSATESMKSKEQKPSKTSRVSFAEPDEKVQAATEEEAEEDEGAEEGAEETEGDE